ncbi:hypothetical protein N0V90_004862 [Kalmusia sp. IMI 367209]|nr:hypothetical protein N0V90_004862 [Kalmusia sp. IMI 367209]
MSNRLVKAGKREAAQEAGALLTIIKISSGDSIDAGYLVRRIQRYLATCDVFTLDFLHCVEFTGAREEDVTFHQDAKDQLREWGNSWTKFTPTQAVNDGPPPGPYVVAEHQLRQVWRVYDDFNQAFLVSTWPSENDELLYEDNGLAGESFTSLGVAVPSRLYFSRTKERPLDGVRIAIKDMYHLNGLRTSVCNRAYHDLYPPRTETADCVKLLLDLGAIVVGKTHLSSFAWKEEPTECIDYQAPFNPRADGYQSPAGSSSGSGAAIASYDWLDFTLGTDTTGSGRRPALWNGCFALRPSASMLPTNGMVPTCPTFDVPSFFGRDIQQFQHFAQSWYGNSIEAQDRSKRPWQIIYPTDYLPVGTTDQMQIFNDFMDSLATYLKVTPRKVSIAEQWKESALVSEKRLDKYLENVQEHGFFFDLYHCFDQFREDFSQQYGHQPFLTKPLKWVWGIGRLISEDQKQHALDRYKVFKQWFIEKIMQPDEMRTIIVLPIETLEPRYRDVTPDLPIEPPKGLSVLYLSPTLGAPEIVVPAGHVPFESRVTEQIEYLPMAVSLLGAPGTDMELITLTGEFLAHTGRPGRVSTGKTMWHI